MIVVNLKGALCDREVVSQRMIICMVIIISYSLRLVLVGLIISKYAPG